MEAEECGVCCEETMSVINCKECGHGACRRCVETYLLGATSDPHCMSCKREWGMLFLRKHLDAVFLDGPWKERRKELLRARARRRLGDGVLCPCPSCPHGSVSSSTGTCSSCWAKVCRRCLAHWEEGHACREETVRSLDEIKKTTRRCPGCHVPIEKELGCFQMFCTQCHTSFDWKDGKLLDKIHNPHYYNHQEEHRRLCAMEGKKKGLQGLYRLVAEVGRQARLASRLHQTQYHHHHGTNRSADDLYEEDEARRREQCRVDMWSRFHKRGVAILLSAKDGSAWEEQVRAYLNDLKEELMDYNEHVDGCLQLRGGRLFPCRASVLACA